MTVDDRKDYVVIQMKANEISSSAHTLFWLEGGVVESAGTVKYLQEQTTEAFERLADLMGYTIAKKPSS